MQFGTSLLKTWFLKKVHGKTGRKTQFSGIIDPFLILPKHILKMNKSLLFKSEAGIIIIIFLLINLQEYLPLSFVFLLSLFLLLPLAFFV